jgi:hypothetical protein
MAARVADFYLYGRSLVGDNFPSMENGVEAAGNPSAIRKLNLRAGMRVVLCDPQPAEIADAQATLVKRELELRPLAQMETAAPGKSWRLELWEAAPTWPMRGVNVDTSQAETPEGVTRVTAGNGTEFIYSAEEKGAAWKLALPEGLAPGKGEPFRMAQGKPFDLAQGKPAGGLRVRIGGNARLLRLLLTDGKGRALEETMVDPGTAVRDAWLQLKPGLDYRYLQVQRGERDQGGSFVIEGVEQ